MSVLRPGEAAKKLQISKKKLYELISKGEIPAIRIGYQWRLSEVALERFLSGGVEVGEGAKVEAKAA
jgi:excisionase family DNA binding protein